LKTEIEIEIILNSRIFTILTSLTC